MNTYRADVAILMPGDLHFERTVIRYGGLVDSLTALSISSFFAEGHASYDPKEQAFQNVFDLQNPPARPIAGFGMAAIIRDLTMPAGDKPLHDPALPAKLIHDPQTNWFLADKANMVMAAPDIHPLTRIVSAASIIDAASEIPGKRVILKPVTGMASRGVKLLPKSRLGHTSVGPGRYLLQEVINTTRGIPELGVVGVHNIRAISIGNRLVGSIARVGGNRKNILCDDAYGNFIDSGDLPDTMHAIINTVHAVMAAQPGNGENVIAIDMMRGINAAGELVDVLCEANRRPMRISPYVLRDGHKNLDPKGVLHLARLWDLAEAALIARQVG